MTSKVFMGIDPSTKTGVVIVKGEEVLHTETITAKTGDYITNGSIIGSRLLELINEYRVGYINIENYATNARFRIVDMVTLGTVIRFMLLSQVGTGRELYKLYQTPPKSLKLWATRNGNAKKPDMKSHAKAKYNFVGNNDEVDAFFLAKYLQAGIELNLIELNSQFWLST